MNTARSNAVFFAKGISYSTASHILTTIRGLFSGYLVARMFQPDMYGEYQYILNVVGLLSLFGLPGLVHAVARAWAMHTPFSLSSITKSHIKICLIGSLILLCTIPFHAQESLWTLLLAAALLFPLQHIAIVRFEGVTTGKAHFKHVFLVNLIWTVLAIAAVLAIVFFYQSSLLMLVIALALGPLICLWGSKHYTPQRDEDEKNTKDIMRYGWHLSIATLPMQLVWFVDKVVVQYFFGLHALAIFSIAVLIPDQLRQFSYKLLPVTFAKQAQSTDVKGNKGVLLLTVAIGTLLYTCAALLYIQIYPHIHTLLFPHYSLTSMKLLAWVSILTIIAHPSYLLIQYLTVHKCIRQQYWCHWISGIFFIVCLVYLLPQYELLGVAMARVLFQLVYALMALWYVLQHKTS